ncbi:hypothetical protein F5Y00DRAFT_269093 [Daldinia vernicosa]|uniref:uncharacterized protein n=1 Tax=Daldinia vernicosa TaxID=114800 RepID=UPI0020086B9C|nr:uncharacterized protein F5Y00DRAFT_269093 [Daldinia vernicosa]KAI0853666.1 hypothetical protein F5Y00DRAFT_269093 [Daldinia vernicosa]
MTVMDALTFYYQWRTHPSTRWALTITTAKGQYTFHCLVMGYKNSNAYVQRQMDILFEDVDSVDCYLDNNGDLIVQPQHAVALTVMLLQEAQIVFATPAAARETFFRKAFEPTLVVMDENARMRELTTAMCISSLFAVKLFILLGDPQQLLPFIGDNHPSIHRLASLRLIRA